MNEDGVANITVANSVFTKTQNGVRIKSWARPSGGFATNIMFRNLVMRNVGNPIFIDQNYCPHNVCPRQVLLPFQFICLTYLTQTSRKLCVMYRRHTYYDVKRSKQNKPESKCQNEN